MVHVHWKYLSLFRSCIVFPNPIPHESKPIQYCLAEFCVISGALDAAHSPAVLDDMHKGPDAPVLLIQNIYDVYKAFTNRNCKKLQCQTLSCLCQISAPAPLEKSDLDCYLWVMNTR